MAKLSVFDTISLDGYFTDVSNSERFAHEGAPDAEFDEFTRSNATGGGALLMGRKTYEVMIQFWPTAAAMAQMPDVAKAMNAMPKYVFSHTLRKPTWENTRVLSGKLKDEVARLKAESDVDIAVLGSGRIVAQLTELGLVDEYQIVVAPVVLGAGRSLFEGVARHPKLRILETHAFRNGKVFLRYAPASA
jgi:dihydrofolate reductase